MAAIVYLCNPACNRVSAVSGGGRGSEGTPTTAVSNSSSNATNRIQAAIGLQEITPR